ncbi:c-type cytochrome biogenesis protein CcsB [Streptomyces spiroverticillatus]|uniref:C-type cytochrome biogenesis protein CcsB n=1 Tax=Streptomyces finlayi TaxID=67296 RepID=A0A919C7E4_9ACTN|nr:c-type cytochrome biogenesis protein CcsB [Streptomyces finlayi]GGZ90093.1 c-type cytochrome biogenesis protein CcsB [Streptomyces spiroverticillatus]GHC80905.1 c-type cytochrome biogenesis protein CcsB [Streptomyces finlayi]
MILAAAAVTETNENLAQISNVLIYSAMAVYTLAFLAHIAEWTFGSRSKVGRTAAALTRPAAAPAVTVRSKGSTAVLDKPKVVTRAAAGTRDAEDGEGAAGGTEKGDLYGRIAISLTVLAFLVAAGGVATRALSVQRAPWGNMYEFSITFSTVAVGIYLALLPTKMNVRWIGLPLVTTVLLDLGIATKWLYTDSDQLVPALDSYWLWIHVSTAIFCGAVFYVGAVGTIGYLLRDRYEVRAELGETADVFKAHLATLPKSNAFVMAVRAARVPLRRVMDSSISRLPSAATLDKFSYRINAGVFPLWTFTIVAGAIWAGDAWGRFWGWDPKEVWSFVTWIAYACYLHARATAGWKGRKAAYLALFAFATWIWNYYGVNIFLSGKHSYAGV